MNERTDDNSGSIVTPATRMNKRVTRKGLLTVAAGAAGATAAGAVGLAALNTRRPLVAHASGASDDTSGDTPLQIFTAALIAEDLATTFYYNGLVGPVITDPNLAGKHGTAQNPENSPRGNPGNVDYLRAAISEEIDHANVLRSLIGGASASGDPVQTFYFPTGSFDTLDSFTGLLNALESAFIGAYLAATKEFAQMAADTKAGVATYTDASNNPFTSVQLEYFSQVAAAIMGIEAEHRVLGRVISNSNPANNLCYEQTDGITSVYNGSTSAVAALTPFLSAGSGKTAYSFGTALANASSVSLPCTGGLPPQ